MENKLIKDLLLGFIKIHILYHASIEPIYGSVFQNELKRHGYDISFGTLYPVFHRLERGGYLKSFKENVNGKIRKYYSITDSGFELLTEAKAKMNELVSELNENE